MQDRPTPVWYEDAGTITATWIDPLGREWPLSDTSDELGWFTTQGPAGWGATPIELITDPLPRGGEQIRFIRSKPRRLQWPIYIGGRDHAEYTRRRREITRAFTMTKQRMTPGILRVARPGGAGTAREIACFYEQGLEGESGQDHLWSKPVIQLFCPDGYWSDTLPVPIEQGFTGGDPPSSFFTPFISVASSRVSSGGEGDDPIEVLNAGDVDAWPTWLLTGPMSKFTAENLTIGSRFALEYPLGPGQQIAITTNRPTVRGPGDANFSRYVDWFNPLGTELWPLVDGLNEIRFAVSGSASGTKARMEFTPRYETA
ncbi:hypothetical protein AB0F93_00055 [Micromonospora tulbaghiae]|uniref:hypothetical protein n=1 Tax=Micromonospora tulbaghiae TaxID=479978 RepID=UPI00331E497F